MRFLYAMAALLTIVLSLLPGCSEKEISDTELSGIWSGKTSAINPTGISANFKFATDHTFTVTNLPRRYIWRAGDPNEVTNGRGTWRWEKRRGQQFWHLKLDFTSVDALGTGLHTEILADVLRGKPRLFFWEEEEGGQRFEFQRVE
jgi:hypothetical protein